MIEPSKGMRFSSGVKHLYNMHLSVSSQQIQTGTTNTLDGLLMVAQRKGAYKIHCIFARFMHIWDQHMYAPQLRCLTFGAEPASGLGQSSTADQPWMAHGSNSMGLFKWSHIWIWWEVLSHELQNGPCRKTLNWNIWTFSLRWGWVCLERTRILSGIQFTTYFIKKFVLQTKQFVRSFVHVILTRQTCGQRSIKAAESKRRALGNHFSEQIWYIFRVSKCRGD